MVDIETHQFLLRSINGNLTDAGVDVETSASLEKLRSVGILQGGTHLQQHKGDANYSADFTDLTARHNSKLLRAVVRVVGQRLSPVLPPPVVALGVVLLLLEFILWVATASVSAVAGALLDTPLLLFSLVFVLQAVQLVLHEAGHYAIAWRAGYDPDVGVGLYFTGPVAYVDLSPLDVASKKVRLTADMAGLSIDGYFVAAVTVAYWITGLPVLAATSVILASVSMASFEPAAKSDGYWALRDLFNGRATSATWSRPRQLMRAAWRRDDGGRFARALLAVYGLFAVIGLCAAPRWISGVAAKIAAADWVELLFPALVSVVFVSISVLAALRAGGVKAQDGGHQ
ncbi:hypothetical protein [Arthrobacter sp. 2MCAF14]|uniref:hypothetical protein n=1 Tax=Arthrobacter sp. 2MCAF14 TaxID=3232982 RepID=UPI003F92202C